VSFYEKGRVRIHYEEAGSGYPLLLIPGGGLNSTIAALANPFNPIDEFKGEYRCIAADLRNANGGQSSGQLEIPTPFYDNKMTGWGPDLVKRRPDITMETVEKFLTKMYRTNPDFVFTVTRDFVRNCQTP